MVTVPPPACAGLGGREHWADKKRGSFFWYLMTTQDFFPKILTSFTSTAVFCLGLFFFLPVVNKVSTAACCFHGNGVSFS